MVVVGLDPGPTRSGWCALRGNEVLSFGKIENRLAAERIWDSLGARVDESVYLAVERVASFGMAVGAEVFETCFEAGRIVQEWVAGEQPWASVYRKDVKMHLCGSMRAKDGNVRQALLDLWGGKEKAIGKKKSPGPLYGMSGDCWAALAVAVTYRDTGKEKP